MCVAPWVFCMNYWITLGATPTPILIPSCIIVFAAHPPYGKACRFFAQRWTKCRRLHFLYELTFENKNYRCKSIYNAYKILSGKLSLSRNSPLFCPMFLLCTLFCSRVVFLHQILSHSPSVSVLTFICVAFSSVMGFQVNYLYSRFRQHRSFIVNLTVMWRVLFGTIKMGFY